MSFVRCPICSRSFDSEKSEALPFCSDRCRSIDLSRWLDEKYVMPVEPADDTSDDESADDAE